ncbi:hypothetical protein HMPREF3226_01375 [Prevotella corporis]|uniref:Uncharacterized protein n=1 Tax=Prevotella corporis TaxID=28128 RepID=A0A133Q9K1_9BACT|nr:hypothetical protein HMPREF3226_01375 [Prevotella corporis]
MCVINKCGFVTYIQLQHPFFIVVATQIITDCWSVGIKQDKNRIVNLYYLRYFFHNLLLQTTSFFLTLHNNKQLVVIKVNYLS